MRERAPDGRQLGEAEPATAELARHQRAGHAERDELLEHGVREVVGAIPRLDLRQHGVRDERAHRVVEVAHETVTGTRWTDVFA